MLNKKASVKKLLGISKDVNVNERDQRGRTALILASMKARLEVVELLLTCKDIDVDARDDYSRTALHHVQRGVAIDQNVEERSKVVQKLLASNANIRARDHNFATPLMFAAANGQVEMVTQLLDAKALVNDADFERFTALTYACYAGHTAVELYLRTAGGADSNDCNAAQDDVSIDGATCDNRPATSFTPQLSDHTYYNVKDDGEHSIDVQGNVSIDGTPCDNPALDCCVENEVERCIVDGDDPGDECKREDVGVPIDQSQSSSSKEQDQAISVESKPSAKAKRRPSAKQRIGIRRKSTEKAEVLDSDGAYLDSQTDHAVKTEGRAAGKKKAKSKAKTAAKLLHAAMADKDEGASVVVQDQEHHDGDTPSSPTQAHGGYLSLPSLPAVEES